MFTNREVCQQEHQQWFDVAVDDPLRHIYIYERDGEPVGFVGVTRHAECPGEASWGFYLAPQSPRGIGRDLGCTALRVVFEELGIETLVGQVLQHNVRSVIFHERLGFEAAAEGAIAPPEVDEVSPGVIKFRLTAAQWRAIHGSALMKDLGVCINGRRIGDDRRPYIIAEMSANHGGSLDRAFAIIKSAKDCGADAVKLQSYRPDTITLDSGDDEFVIRGGLWDGRRLFDLYEEAHLPWDWHAPLFEYAAEVGITIFSSPFDASAVDLLESLDAPAYKIASFEVIDLPLVRRVAATGKPLIISTGMASMSEIAEAVGAARGAGCEELVLLHCVSGYPAPAADYNLHTMRDMRQRFECMVGLSDHTLDNITAISAVALGAGVIEKHFTLDRAAGGPDDSFSLEPDGLRELCEGARTAWEALGRIDYGRKSSEQGNVQFRRSLYWVKDLEAGAVVTPDAIRSVRPGYGLAPKRFDELIGQRVVRAVRAKTATREEDFGS